MNFSAVILAGGKSSRMGRDKAFLEIGGQTLLARQIQLVREVGAAEVFISGRADTDYSMFDGRVLLDELPDAGPLAGIARALAAMKSPLLLVLAVDLPEVTAPLLRRLAAHGLENGGSIPRSSGQVEPLAAFYPKAACSLAETLLRDGDNSVKTFAEGCVSSRRASFYELSISDAPCFANWNAPFDVVMQ